MGFLIWCRVAGCCVACSLLDDNRITSVDEQAFEFLTNLQILRLGSNKITSIAKDTFKENVNLQILRLENNKLSKIELGLFDFDIGCTPIATNGKKANCLQQLHLQRNFLTRLQDKIFESLGGLQELYLQVNPELREIPKSIFAAASKLAQSLHSGRLGMLGSASGCVKIGDKDTTKGKFYCTCAAGFVDGSSDNSGSYCEAVDCGLTIKNLPGRGISKCEQGKTTFFKDGKQGECLAQCEIGFAGKANYKCGESGEWEGLYKCTPLSCAAEIAQKPAGALDQNAEAFCREIEQQYGGPPCVARCKTGYVPKVGTSASFRCAEDGKWNGTLICEPIACSAKIGDLVEARIRYLDGTSNNPRVTKDCADTKYKQSCRVQCDAAYSAVDKEPKPFECTAAGIWEPGALGDLDCKGKRCGREPLTNFDTVAKCLGDVTYGGDNCGVSCATGYVPDGGFASRVQEYCKLYSEKCKSTFEEEFGALDDSGMETCVFQAQQQTHGSGGEDDLDKDTITCRTQWLKKEPAECSAARLQLGTKNTPRPGEQCVKKLCREGSIECLICADAGQWSPSLLSCKAVKCKETFAGIKTAACASRPAEELDECERKFDIRVGPDAGVNCDGKSKFSFTCPIDCGRGYVPKQVPFLCEADQLGNGLWQGNLDCKSIKAPIKIFTEPSLNIRLDGIDQNAVLLGSTFDKRAHPEIGDANGFTNGTFVEDGKCPNGRFAEVFNTNGTECIPNASFHPKRPTTLHMRCTGGIEEDYNITVGDPAWEVANAKYAYFQTAERFCRNDCGSFIHYAVNAVPGECANTGEGDKCNVVCNLDASVKYQYVCDPFAQKWLVSGKFGADGELMKNSSLQGHTIVPPGLVQERKLTRCQQLFDTTSTTTTTIEAKAESSGLGTGGTVAVVLFPLVIIIVSLALGAYFFGFLARFGLQPNKTREAIYGEVYGEIYGPGGLAMQDMSIYNGQTAKKLEEFSVRLDFLHWFYFRVDAGPSVRIWKA